MLNSRMTRAQGSEISQDTWVSGKLTLIGGGIGSIGNRYWALEVSNSWH